MLGCQFTADASNGIPDGKPADDDDGEEDDNDVPGMDADRVGIDNETATAVTQPYNAEGLLQPAEEQS